MLIKVLLPEKADNRFPGGKLPLFIFYAITLVGAIRSLIHIFSPDGGAGSIAGMNLSVEGANGIIFAFALWGSSQLLISIIQGLVAIRFRSLIPLMYFLLIIETLLRMLIGRIKPISFAYIPPGAWGNLVILPIGIVMLGLCFVKPRQ